MIRRHLDPSVAYQILHQTGRASTMRRTHLAVLFSDLLGFTSIAETVEPELDGIIPGFGEIFRMLSYDEIGSAALLSRALAGLKQGKVVFVIPGSRGAVRLAMEKLILPELGHLAGDAVKTR